MTSKVDKLEVLRKVQAIVGTNNLWALITELDTRQKRTCVKIRHFAGRIKGFNATPEQCRRMLMVLEEYEYGIFQYTNGATKRIRPTSNTKFKWKEKPSQLATDMKQAVQTARFAVTENPEQEQRNSDIKHTSLITVVRERTTLEKLTLLPETSTQNQKRPL